MTRSALRARALSAFLFCCLLGSAVTGHAADAWVSTATRGLLPATSNTTGSVPANMPVRVVLSLRPRNGEQFLSLARNVNRPGSPAYGRFLTSSQFMASYAPTTADAKLVADYLRSKGFKNIGIAPNRLLVSATGTASMAQAAFNTQMVKFSAQGKTWYVNTRDAQVPSSLARVVTAVLGLNNFRVTHFLKPSQHNALGVPDPFTAAGLSPQQFQKAYGATNAAEGSRTSIAIFASSDVSQVIPDLRVFENTYGLPHVPATVVPALAPGQTVEADAGGLTEWDMDTQTSTGIAGNVAALYIYDAASGLLTDMPYGFNQFVVDNVAKAGSASFGACDGVTNLLGIAAATDPILAQAAAQGQTVFVSSGDVGPACPIGLAGVPIGVNGAPDSGVPLQQSYPSSSPFVVAVGGTTLSVDLNGNYNTEITWPATGGGPSTFEPAPEWQQGTVTAGALQNLDPLGAVSFLNDFVFGPMPANAPPGLSLLGRGVPDIAMDADFLVSPALIVVNGAGSSNGGTSLASPLALGAWARVQTAHCNAFGFAAPLFYNTVPAAALHDIIIGNNGLWPATPGWDFTTGLGSLNVDAIIAALGTPPATCSGGGGVNTPPTAALAATPASGAVPLAVSFDASASAASGAGNSIISYNFDFGDGSAPQAGASPAASHTYTIAGSYTASVSVADNNNRTGVASSTITVNPVYLPSTASCTLPGPLVATDPAADELGDPANSALDVKAVHLAEPFTTVSDRSITFTLKLGTAVTPAPPPNTIWQVGWTTPNSNGVPTKFYVSYNTATTPTGSFDYGYVDETTTPSFNQGQCDPFLGTPLGSGACPVTGGYDATKNQIVLKLDTSFALQYSLATGSTMLPFQASFAPGTVLGAVGGSTQMLLGAAGTGGELSVDSGGSGAYYVQGNQFCNPNPPAPSLTATPATLDFGKQAVRSSSSPHTVTLRNAGNATFIFSGSTITGDYAQGASTCGSTLAVNASCEINVSFTPAAAGTRAGRLSVNGAGGIVVGLTGSGVTAPLLTLAPDALEFGYQPLKKPSAYQRATLTNSGSAVLNITRVAVAPIEFSMLNHCPKSLLPGQSCGIDVRYTPQVSADSFGSLVVETNASAQPAQVALHGFGVPHVAEVTFSPAALDFGTRAVGSASPAQTVTIINSGDATLSINGMSTVGPDAPTDYSKVSYCPSQLTPGARCTVKVTFKPVLAGGRPGTLTLLSNSGSNPDRLPLSGEGQ